MEKSTVIHILCAYIKFKYGTKRQTDKQADTTVYRIASQLIKVRVKKCVDCSPTINSEVQNDEKNERCEHSCSDGVDTLEHKKKP